MRLFLVVMLISLCAGCATQYGSTVKNNIDANQIIALESVEKLGNLYLPAKTTFSLAHPVLDSDIFSQTVINGLRDRGFAVEEFKKGATPVGVPLSLALNELRGEGLYRVWLSVDNRVITRAYTNDAGLITQASAWAIKE